MENLISSKKTFFLTKESHNSIGGDLQEKTKSNKIFFNGLNELRGLAALLVIFHHVELHLSSIAFSSYFNLWYFTGNIGKHAVFLFFVLSGFLITFLLIKEKEHYKTIHLKKFFLRRMLRIWPLYYLVLIISLFLIPLLAFSFDIFKLDSINYDRITHVNNYQWKGLLGYMFFIPNVALNSGYLITGASQSWSIGVEEQFYVIWPFLILFVKRNKLLLSFLFFLVTIPVLIYFSKNGLVPYPFSLIFKSIPFHFMAIGGIGAFYYYYKKAQIEIFTTLKFTYPFIIIAILIFLFTPVLPNYLQEVCLAILYIFLLLCTINNFNYMVFKNSVFSFLGKISYGLYMYHLFIIFLFFPLIIKYIPSEKIGFLYSIIVHLIIFVATIGISYLSYIYFELPFIKRKDLKYNSF